ncbi:MAG: TetR family transcriptional regulator [Streptomyces sp.]|jgi:AcrR family transcriptional regulator|uniref:TetR/AcrR family transcriptional regulator n=1 Tax=Streptomyces sp. TaxID=1931 RepID=UPI0025E264FE|nr:TetR family transcriptional regulator [Streptomyces sp.]MBW8794071.1 TetR family transcriptional regulator [Streptomyces sp.]
MTGTPSRGRESGNGPAARRSDASRSAILAAARERFAADGYERATIRAIAKDARIDPSMVMRYFGSKDGLFAAAVTLDLRMPDVSQVPHTEVGRALTGHFLDIWEANEELTAVLRVAVTNNAGAERLQGIFREQVVPVAQRVCPDPEQVATRAGLCAAQLLGLALTRYVVRLPPVVALAREEIVAWLGPTVQRYLTVPSP